MTTHIFYDNKARNEKICITIFRVPIVFYGLTFDGNLKWTLHIDFDIRFYQKVILIFEKYNICFPTSISFYQVVFQYGISVWVKVVVSPKMQLNHYNYGKTK